ncbi:uncharacterized protein LDX57_005779 [Aspergillus melleus]|uniref:uncharacterized protein n=1 Tax=Aspergillus melleus TaxID=138277 RepID=UPI001E8E9F94|nr:uncharacterized protein LDX57_005779 [Aspergillus melleus]KAH8428074.1 hypothetical protein LDX57_005779 [Aspergillus melleus]
MGEKEGITDTAATCDNPTQSPPMLENEIENQNQNQPSVFERFSPARKRVITVVLCYCGLLTPISSTAVLSAIPEVAATFHTTGSIINVSNALFMAFMALGPMIWAPISGLFGRRPVFLISSTCLTAFSVGTALAPNLPAFFIFRMLSALQGTAVLVVGAVVIGDIYLPTERGTALGWFLSGTLIGPTIAPLLGGIIVTWTSWRVIFWTQTGMAGLSTVLVVFLLPETIHEKKTQVFDNLTLTQRSTRLLRLMNPTEIVMLLFTSPNFMIVGLAVSSFMWNQYSLLTPIRYVLNPRFHLTTPLQSALFFIAPGAGYLTGTFCGGRWSDYIVKRYMAKRGRRVPEDRLNSAVIIMAILVPGCMLVYGWAVEKEVGGIPLVVIAMYLQGVTQLLCLPSLNTYCVDAMEESGKGSLVVAGNYLTRFMFAAASTAVCLPAIQAIGVGWFSTISALFISVSAGLVWLVAKYGEGWRLKREGG